MGGKGKQHAQDYFGVNMNILYTLNSGKPGGMEQHVLDLVNGMVLAGHKVYVWCPEGEIGDWYKDAGATVLNKKILFEIDLVYIFQLMRFLKQNKIDVIHSHELKAVCNSLLAAFLAGTKVKTSHTHTPISTWRINRFKRFLDVLVYSTFVNLFSSKEVALTEVAKSQKKKEGIHESKLVVIPNALDTSAFTLSYNDRLLFREEIRRKYSIPQIDFVFGCVSRITQEKGHEILVRAFKRFLDAELFHKRNFYLLIAGGGILEDYLRDLSKKLNISDRVIITGIFNKADLVKFYASFDVFIFPSLAEGFGLVLIEAMYSQVPVICSDLEVLKEVGGGTIQYFKTASIKDLTDKMTGLCKKITTDEDLKLQEARGRIEEKYTMGKFIDNYLSLYSSFLCQ